MEKSDNFSPSKLKVASAWCRTCSKEALTDYRHSILGCIGRMYDSQKTNSKRRGHTPPVYSLKQFTQWVLEDFMFDVLYINWVDSGYEKDLIPSSDRLDDSKPYSLNNLRLGTWYDNRQNQYKTNKQTKGKPVSQFNKGVFIQSFHSCAEAGRQLNINASNIQTCASGKRPNAGGYTWLFK